MPRTNTRKGKKQEKALELDTIGREIDKLEWDFNAWLLGDPAGINWICNCPICTLGRQIAVNEARELPAEEL